MALTSSGASDPGNDLSPEVTAGGPNFWVVMWQSTDPLDGTIGADNDILVSSSINNGQTWSVPSALNSNASTDSGDDETPHAATDRAGRWVIAWQSNDDLDGTIGTDEDILVVRSADNGQTMSAPVALNTNAASNSGDDVNPHVSTDGTGTWVAVWQSETAQGGVAGGESDIQFARSINNGQSWSPAAALNTNAASDSGDDETPHVVADGAGHWVAVWQSDDDLDGTIGTDEDILFARSTNNGQTWSAPVALNTDAGSDSGDDSIPQVATDGAGNWVAVWRSYKVVGFLESRDDILFARSTDNGQTWSAPVAVSSVVSPDSGNDGSPQVATDESGNWLIVWQSDDALGGTLGTDNDILVSRSTNDGQTWSAPVALNTNAGSDSEDDGTPQVASDGRGNWVTVWQSEDSLGGTIGTDSDILMARSTDHGQTWGVPSSLNSTAASDSRDDFRPHVSVDRAGNWVTVWQSFQNVGGTIGTDGDILVAHSTDTGQTWSAASALNSNAASDSGDDSSPQTATDGAGAWVAVWGSKDDLGGTIGTDPDILASTAVADVFDFGDAPLSYATTLANDGARHIATGPTLGARRDIESDAQPTFVASGDDADTDGDDEDGIAFNGPLVAGQTASIDVTVAGGLGILDAWIDFNGDGDWTDAGEKLALNQSTLNSGTTTVTFTVLGTATSGMTYGRFRLSTDGTGQPKGPASDGEVEDYQVIVSGATSPGHVTITTNDHPLQNPGSDGIPDTFLLRRSGQNLELLINGTPTFVVNAALISSLTVNGSSDDDDIDASDMTLDVTLSGGLGNDTLAGGYGNDRLYGNDGDDSMNGGAGRDLVAGGAGNDKLDGGDGDDRLFGRRGDDTLTGGPGRDRFEGGQGTDLIVETTDVSTATLTNRELTQAGLETERLSRVERFDLTGGGGNNTLDTSGFSGEVTLRGGAGNDSLVSGNGNDLLEGGDGHDTLNGGEGDDELEGSSGNDSLSGWTGNDTLSGSGGDDVLIGVAGNDSLLGGVGNDTLLGGADGDTLDGGAGDDILAGHGNYNGATTSDTGHAAADAGDTFAAAIDSDTIHETFLSVGDWIDQV